MEKIKFKGQRITEELKGYARRLLREKKRDYIIRALDFKKKNGMSFFNTDEYELLSYEILGTKSKPEFMKECNFDEEGCRKFKDECLEKLEYKMMDLVLTDLKQSIYRPRDYERRLKRIFGENYPLRGLCDKLIIQVSRLNYPAYEITKAREVQQIANWHDLPWIYIREEKDRKKLWGISETTSQWMKEWFEEIDEEEYQANPVSIVMPKQLARLLLNILADHIQKVYNQDDKIEIEGKIK